MKKVSILISFLFCAIASFSQGVPITNNISISNAATQYHVVGLLTGDVAVKIPTLDTLLHPATTFAGSIIRQTDGFAYMSNGVFWERFGFTSGDTLLAELPLYIAINGQGQRVLKILHPDGIVTPGYVSWSGSGLTFDVTSALYYINYQQYISPSSSITLAVADPTNSRIDKIGVDTNSAVIAVTGTAAVTPIAPQLNPSSQLSLTDIFLLAGDTIPSGITLEVIYDGATDAPAQWTPDTIGTISVDYVNTDNPYHLTEAAFVSTYTDQSKLTFTDTGLDTAQTNEILKMFIYSNGAFTNNIYFQLWNDSTAVTTQLALNAQFGFNPLDSNVYQNVTIPFTAFNFIGGNIFNKLVITMGGADTTGAKGLYFDYIQLQTGINNTPIGTNNKVDSVTMVGSLEYYWVNGFSTFITDLSLIADTVYTRKPIAVDTTTIPGKQILYLLHLNGLESGVVTVDSCMTIDITATVFYLNYKQYTGVQTIGVVVQPADPTFPRIDRVVIDSNLVITVIQGTASATPIAPPFNSFSQVELAQILVGAGVTCLGTIDPIYDGILDEPAQWDTATSGTISVNFSNTANPYHLTQAAFVVTYTDSSQLIFTKPSGTDTVKATSVLKGFIYVLGNFTNQISAQWYNGSTAVSNQLLLNPYFNVNDSNQYQIFAPPLNAWSWPGGIVFNKLILTFGGNDVSGAKGLYLDWIQLQTGISNVSTALQLTTTGTSGAATLIGNVLNIPIYSGGGGGTQATIYTADSSLASDRTVDLNGKVLLFNDLVNGTSLTLNPPAFSIGMAGQDGTATSNFEFKGDLAGNLVFFDLQTFDGTNLVKIHADAQANTLTHTADTILLNSTLLGTSIGYVWTLADPVTGSGYWGASSGSGGGGSLQDAYDTSIVRGDNPMIQGTGSTDFTMTVKDVDIQVGGSGGVGSFNVESNGSGSNHSRLVVDNSGQVNLQGDNTSSGHESDLIVAHDSIHLTPYAGQIRIDSVRANTSTNKAILGYDTVTHRVERVNISIGTGTSYQIQTASGSTAFTFTGVSATLSDFAIFVNGSRIRQTTDYTVSGNVVTIPTIISGDQVIFQQYK